jgi:lactoylglutathione lyase
MQSLHVCLNVSDADRLAEWYETELGFERSWGFTSGETRNLYLDDGTGFEIQLSDTADDDVIEESTAWDHFAVGVDDVDAVFTEIDHHGVVQAPSDQPDAGTRTAFVEDPDGHVIELVEQLS